MSNIVTEKKCNACGATKPLGDFYTSGRKKYAEQIAGYQSECKKCHNARKARDHKRTYTKEIGRYLNLRKNHGITPEEYDVIFKSQNGRCCICGNDLGTGKDPRVHVDHDHKSKKIRGLLCQSCNLVLGHAHDDKNILERAVKYLMKFQ